MPAKQNLVGQKFYRLTVLNENSEKDRNGHTQWDCACDCGDFITVRAGSLKSGTTRSCGCLRRETTASSVREAKTTHGLSNSSEYRIWTGIKQRCYNSQFRDYYRYGGRGITMSDEWRDSFEAFYRDMGPRPSKDHSVERRKNDLGYSKDNCHWATWDEQANNRSNSLYYTYNGVSRTLAAWCRELKLNYPNMHYFLNQGMTFEEAFQRHNRKI